MKRIGILLIALAMLLVAGAALAEGTGAETITAEVLEIRRDGTLQVRSSGQDIIVVPGPNCTYDAYNGIYAGDIIRVTHEGVMTASMPPQITATFIGCSWVEGVVQEGLVQETDPVTGRVLLTDMGIGQVWITLPSGYDAPSMVGQTIRVYYNGVMALSMPPQIHAISVRVK